MNGEAAGGGPDGGGRSKKNGGNEGKREVRHAHPGGSGSVLGVRLLRYSGVQGTSLLISNLLQLVSLLIVASFLIPAQLGQFSLLLFLGSLIGQVFMLLTKPGTIRRTFGAGDDDDDDDEGDDEVSSSPKHTLGVGLVWAVILGISASVLIVVLRVPIADWLLGHPEDENLIVWSGVLGGALVLCRLTSIALWFERRPGAYVVADGARPALSVGLTLALLGAGLGLEGAIMGTALGTLLAAALGAVLLRGSYEPAFDPKEIRQIIGRGKYRAPVVMSFWFMQQADVFILSRMVDHSEVGLYNLASRVGFVVAFLPQGFRMAMRPLRKSAIFQAVREQYGKRTERGELLGYFTLLCIFSVLLMVVGGQLLIDIAPPEYAAAAPLVPLTALAMVMPALFRTVNGQTSWPSKRRSFFIYSILSAVVVFIALSVALVPLIGIYGIPVAMFTGFAIPSGYFFYRCQTSRQRIDFPYAEVGKGLALAILIGGAYSLIPEISPWIEAPIAALMMILYLVLLFVFRVIPATHWPAIAHMARSVVSGRADRFNPRQGLLALKPWQRRRLRAAIAGRVPTEHLKAGAAALETQAELNAEIEVDGARLVKWLRRVGAGGGMPVGEVTEHDATIAHFLFADEPTAVRQATMRRLLNNGAESNDLRALEDMVGHLAKVPDDAWEGLPRDGGRRRGVGRVLRGPTRTSA